jgi:hypothetical protein
MTSTEAKSNLAKQLVSILGLVAIGYAFLAGLRTLTVTDLGWQLATARWIVQHHEIPSTDVFSYTAHGQPWVYPVGSGLLFYGAYLLGGYTLLSWIQAAACAGTVALLVWRGSLVSAVLGILAVPKSRPAPARVRTCSRWCCSPPSWYCFGSTIKAAELDYGSCQY